MAANGNKGNRLPGMSFECIQGHTKEIRALTNAIKNGRVAHAYLFSGPEGVGKSLIARAYASALNCPDFNGTDSCGTCPDCTAVQSGSHQNLIVIGPTDKNGERDPNGLIRIAEIRRLQDALRFKVDAGKKVAIVDSADRLMPSAANAFLKTLEEPPADSVIILVSSKAPDLLPTIQSRCQRVNFRPLSVDAIAGLLERDEGVDGEDAAFAARLSSGSVSAAAAFAKSGAYETRRELTDRLGGLRKGDTIEILKLAGELAKRDDLADVLEFLKTWLRDRLVAMEGVPELATAGANVAGDDAGGRGMRRALLDSFAMIEEARHDITPPRYANKQLTMESLLFGLAELGSLS